MNSPKFKSSAREEAKEPSWISPSHTLSSTVTFTDYPYYTRPQFVETTLVPLTALDPGSGII